MRKNKKASVLLYIIMFVNIAVILGLIIFNSSITVTNDLIVGKNNRELYRNIYDKGHISLESVRKFNSNGNGYADIISCPTNVTMSGSTYNVTGINTEMAYELGTIYCKGDYRGDEFRIYFNIDKTDYDSAYYKGDLVKLKFDTGSSTMELGTTNVAQGLPVSTTINPTFKNSAKGNTNDGDTGTEYKSYKKTNKRASLVWEFDSGDKYLGKVIIKKRKHFWGSYWNNGYLRFYDASGNEVISAFNISWARFLSKITYDLGDAGMLNKVHKVKLNTPDTEKNKYLDLLEFELYEYTQISSGGPHWVGVREFDDSDNTLISFDQQGTGGGDDIDDNMNSDDYRGGSLEKDDGTYVNYAFGYEDDDIIPRKTFWGNVLVGYDYYNIFWNNYKTDEFIENNPYNNMGYSEKIANVSTGYIYLDTYNTDNSDTSVFDLKIIQFDKQAYKDMNTLLPIKSWEGKGIDNFVGYIQLSSTGDLSLAYYKTGNEFPFNFKDYDYSIFVTNKNVSGDISYILTAETDSGTGIYINPINDSMTGTINVLSNHMLMGLNKNFIGENFTVVGAK